ncbi:16S rRNA (cytosine(967)-C(5))-methyltransferase RsmB [Alicyclobacillaceae bacterium I2511]|nr:16S rRNA (cytosine(967)-C(5))-methyltransferase RsmB [Alicyclobacillaceae bacterium I2511]
MIGIARQIALMVLLDMEQRGRYINQALRQRLKGVSLDERDKALVTEIAYGTLQRRRSLDTALSTASRRPILELDPVVLTILRMTAFQIYFLDRVPAYAAVDDGVELCKKHAPRAAGFVNGVLRSLLRNTSDIIPQLLEWTAKLPWVRAMGVRHSYPDWIVEHLEREFGRPRTERMLIACNEPPFLSLRVNARQSTPEQFLQAQTSTFRSQAIISKVSPHNLRLVHGLDVETWPSYIRGEVSVQDETSALVVPLLHPQPGQRLLDMCAGVGTKTTQLAELAGATSRVDACDIYEYKLDQLEQNSRRLHLDTVHTMLGDARSLPHHLNYLQAYDGVLLDAPCSGLGVMRRRPDIRWRRQWQDVESLSQLQRELLTAALQLVKPGGNLVYATCTLLPEENQQVVKSVLQEYGQDWLVDNLVDDDLPAVFRNLASPGLPGWLVTPEQHGTDGFYMVRLRRRL